MIVHFRHEGKSRRALCNARVRGRRPSLWRRDWKIVPEPLSDEEILRLHIVLGSRRIPCPYCLKQVAEDLRPRSTVET